MDLHEMNGQQLAEFYTKQRATTEAFLKLAQAQVDPHGAHAGVIGDQLTKVSTLVDRFDPNDMSRLGTLVGRAEAMLDPSYFNNELGGHGGLPEGSGHSRSAGGGAQRGER